MEIIRISDTRVKLSLDEEDMKKYGIAPKDLNTDSTARRRVLWTLLDEAKRRTGVDAVGKKTLVEAFPGKRGGCEVFVSIEAGERGVHTACYRFADLHTAKRAANTLDGVLEEGEESALYALGQGEVVLTLRLSGDRGARAHCRYGFLEEYGKRERGLYFPDYLREYGTCLYERDAVSRLCQEKTDFSV